MGATAATDQYTDDTRCNMPPAKQTGAQGEAIARRHLRRQGYRIIESNWKSLFGELDIIAERAGVLTFVEVKTRRAANTESALEGITAAKRERMLKAVYLYLHEREFDPEVQWRIDVIAVALGGAGPPKLDHVEDAFDW